jgi:hypothetical protein
MAKVDVTVVQHNWMGIIMPIYDSTLGDVEHQTEDFRLPRKVGLVYLVQDTFTLFFFQLVRKLGSCRTMKTTLPSDK